MNEETPSSWDKFNHARIISQNNSSDYYEQESSSQDRSSVAGRHAKEPSQVNDIGEIFAYN